MSQKVKTKIWIKTLSVKITVHNPLTLSTEKKWCHITKMSPLLTSKSQIGSHKDRSIKTHTHTLKLVLFDPRRPVLIYGKGGCSRHWFQFPDPASLVGSHWCLIIHQRGLKLKTTPNWGIAWHEGCVSCQTHLWDLFLTPLHFCASFLCS